MLQIGKEWKLESPKNLEDAVADLKADHDKLDMSEETEERRRRRSRRRKSRDV